MNVVFSKEAEADLIAIGDYISRDSVSRALDFIERLEKAAYQLGQMPKAFPLLARYQYRSIRRKPFGDYLIFYRIDRDWISIIHVLHGAMDYEALLSEADL